MSTPTSYDAIVIGAGANGLVAAAALGQAGLRVLLVDEQDQAGGQDRAIEFAPGFQAPIFGCQGGWVPRIVERGLGIQLESVQPETAISVPLGPGEFLSLSSNVGRAAHSVQPHSARDAVRLHAFADRIHEFTTFLAALYQQQPPQIDQTGRAENWALLGLGRKLRKLGRQGMTEFLRVMPMPIAELVNDWFECTPLCAAIVTGGVRHLRQGPVSGGTTFALLHHLMGAPHGTVRNNSWWLAGADAFTKAAEAAARTHGVTIRLSAKVARIDVRDDAVAGVVLDSAEQIAATYVVSTADPARTLLGLIDPVWLDPEFLHAVRNIKFRGCSASVLYALDALPEVPGLAPANLDGIVSLTPTVSALERAADAAKYGTVSENPHIEFTVPTLRWPGLAPPGKHVLLATAQYAPYRLRDGAPWDSRLRELLAERVTTAIEDVVPCFSTRVLHRAAFTPRDIEERLGLTEGAATHGELMLDQILFMRPVPGFGRYAMPIQGLYLGGASTHPGPGINGGPGWLAAERLLADRDAETKARKSAQK